MFIATIIAILFQNPFRILIWLWVEVVTKEKVSDHLVRQGI